MSVLLAHMIGALLAPAAVIEAQASVQLFDVPEQCEAFLTVQHRGCLVDFYYTCDGLDDQVVSLSVDETDAIYLQRHDSEFRTLEHSDPEGGLFLTLEEPEPDPLSLTELRENGLDTFDFYDVLNGEVRLHYRGFDRLTDTRIIVDGRVLHMTEFEFTMTGPEGDVLDKMSGQQFIDPEFPLLYPGIFVDQLDGSRTSNNTPVDFIFPGEAGFASRVPQYDCEATL